MSRVDMRRLPLSVLLILAIAYAVIPVSLLWAGPVRAECGFPNRWPALDTIAPTADTVFVGTVSRIVSRKRHHPGTFVVQVDTVLKGNADGRITLHDVWTGGQCVVSWLDVRRGDRIAVALGGESNVNGPVGAIAFVSPLPPDSDMEWAGMRRLTMAQVREAVGLPATDALQSELEQTREARAPAVAAQAAAIVELASQILRQLATPAWLHAVTE
ncbi:MAG: hypothetical protein U0667_02845 [Chloroflexota bacterium]